MLKLTYSTQMYNIIRKITVCQLIILLFILISSSVNADYRDIPKIVPLPAVELESVLFRWLIDTGYEVSPISLKGNKEILTAVKGNEKWQISVMPYSPLASRMSVEYTPNNRSDRNKVSDLWEYLRIYSKDIQEGDTKTEELIPAVIQSHAKSVVCIKGKINNQPVQFSGFIVDSDGIIISTAHDLENLRELTIIFHDGKETAGHVIKSDIYHDLALLDINSTLTLSISLTKSQHLLENGEKVYSIGCPMNNRGRINSGFIDGSLRRVNSLFLWQANIEILPGSSGSPVFDIHGNLVGVIKGSYRGTESTGFIITMETVREFLRGL